MNTGMMDAHNLAWKLALVADGRAPDALLDTYGQERVPVASGVLELTNKIVRLVTMRNRAKRAVRDTVLPVASRMPVVQRRAARKMSQLSVAYPWSPLTQPDGHGRGPKPGDRFPDLEVRGERGPVRLHRLLGSGRHVLVLSGAGVRSAFETASAGDYADIVEGDLRSGFALVRPDGILATRGSASDTHRIVDYLRRLKRDGGDLGPPPSATRRVPGHVRHLSIRRSGVRGSARGAGLSGDPPQHRFAGLGGYHDRQGHGGADQPLPDVGPDGPDHGLKYAQDGGQDQQDERPAGRDDERLVGKGVEGERRVPRTYRARLSESPRPTSTALTMVEKLSSVRIMTAASLVTSVPVIPIAMPMSAFFTAGASLTPSPVMATMWPFFLSTSTQLADDPVSPVMLRRHRTPSPLVIR
jgi:hypothetical protein